MKRFTIFVLAFAFIVCAVVPTEAGMLSSEAPQLIITANGRSVLATVRSENDPVELTWEVKNAGRLSCFVTNDANDEKYLGAKGKEILRIAQDTVFTLQCPTPSNDVEPEHMTVRMVNSQSATEPTHSESPAPQVASSVPVAEEVSAAKKPEALPTISFTVNGSQGPLRSKIGEELDFAWSVSNGKDCRFEGEKVNPEGTKTLMLRNSGNRFYILECSSASGTKVRSKVEVSAPRELLVRWQNGRRVN